MEHDAYAFAIFCGIAICFDHLEGFIEHMPATRRAVRAVKRGLLISPWVLHAFRDFAIHFFVYSGHGY